VSSRPKDEIANALLTRALAMFALTTSTTRQVSPLCVTDGFDDNGLDAIFCEMANSQLWIVQSKWIKIGRGEPGTGDIHKFIQGIKDLVELRFSRFSLKIDRWKRSIRELLANPELKIHIVLAYTGDSFAIHSQRLIDDLLEEYNRLNPMMVFHRLDLPELHRRLVAEVRGASISDDIMLSEWGHLSEPMEAFYGSICAKDIFDLYKKYGTSLFIENLRDFMGSTEVNEAIQQTLTSMPERFFYMNNGITMIAKAMTKKPLGGPQQRVGYFHCDALSIINGAQTVGSIGSIAPSLVGNLEKAYVMCRIISYGDLDKGLAQELTRACNTQNAILAKDFVSQDAVQKALDVGFSLIGKKYVYRSGEEIPDPDRGCTIDEATIALACQNSDVQLTVIAKTKISRLWLDKKIYPRVFKNTVSAESLWQSVEFMRVSDRYIQQLPETDERYEALSVHGNRLLLHCMFQLYTANAQKGKLEADGRIIKKQVKGVARAAHEIIESNYPDTPMYSLFKNLTKTKAIAQHVLLKS
jgi:hypothetical protein